MIRFLKRLFGGRVHAELEEPAPKRPTLDAALDDDSDDYSWFFPPKSTTDPRAWDDYWLAQIEHGVAGMADILVDDRALVAFLHREGLSSGLCVGSGLSVEPLALAQAGLDVTMLDLSPFAVAQVRSLDPAGDYARHFLEPHQLRDGGRVGFVVGDLQDPRICPGPYDFIVERRTLQNFPEDCRDAAIEAVARRLAERGVLFSHCHDGAWRPPAKRKHLVEPWFEKRGWTRGLPDKLEGRCFVSEITTG